MIIKKKKPDKMLNYKKYHLKMLEVLGTQMSTDLLFCAISVYILVKFLLS